MSEGKGPPKLLPLGPDRLRVESGPVSLVLAARWGNRTQPAELEAAGNRALEALEELAAHRALISVDARKVRNLSALPSVVRAMVEATRLFPGPFLTPLIAVAGAVADAVADFLVERGASWAVVNNGGDVAIRLGKGESASVGVLPGLRSAEPVARFRILPEDAVGGAATSGAGGRSFTLGIADSVTVLAGTAAVADVAATLAANRVDLDSPAVERVLAESVVPDTDLRGELVTRNVGPLMEGEVAEALDRGAAWAQARVEEGLIKGAILTLRGQWRFAGWPGEGGLEWLSR